MGNNEIQNNLTQIGEIGNYYGGLLVSKDETGYYWVIENYDTDLSDNSSFEEIPQYLYEALIRFENERDKPKRWP